jgi:hypothetical protein
MFRRLLLILFLMIGVLVLVSPDQILIDAVFKFLPALGLIALGVAVVARR